MKKYVVHHWLHAETEIEAENPESALAEAQVILDHTILSLHPELDKSDVYIYGILVSGSDFDRGEYHHVHLVEDTAANEYVLHG